MVNANADLGDFSGQGDTEGEELILVVAKAKTTTLKKRICSILPQMFSVKILFTYLIFSPHEEFPVWVYGTLRMDTSSDGLNSHILAEVIATKQHRRDHCGFSVKVLNLNIFKIGGFNLI